eukprot:TRINITY_DN22242_c0_g1_i1.p1 TRINITY_DN22242_c0_g1~~TRINITY_DN22242_c0_g1_i1.p1  ORF type:complete len:294 (-),score=30.46 TRINITY_DN22242_c0_g1_i1:634-1515(-)
MAGGAGAPGAASSSNRASVNADSTTGVSSLESGPADGAPSGTNGRRMVRSLLVKAMWVLGGAYALRKLTKRTSRWDHARIVGQSLSGEKFSAEQAARDPMTYFNLRLSTCPATTLADGARVLYYEQAFWSTDKKPYRQRFYMVKPCPKEMKCDVEVASYAVRDIEEYRNFCDRPKNQRPQPEEVVGDMAEHLTTVYLSQCERGRRCLYEGSTPPGGFPNSWNGATRCTSELTIYKGGEIHCWDRAYDDDGNQVWGVRQGPYEFKPRSSSSPSGLLKETYSPGDRKGEDKTSAI